MPNRRKRNVNLRNLMEAASMMGGGVGLPTGESRLIQEARLAPFEQREAEDRLLADTLAQQAAEDAEARAVAETASNEAGLDALRQQMLASAMDPTDVDVPRPMVREMAETYGASPQESRGLAQMMQPQAEQPAQVDPALEQDIGHFIALSRNGVSPLAAAANPEAAQESWTLSNAAGVSDQLQPERVVQEITQYLANNGIVGAEAAPYIAQARTALMGGF